MSEYGTPGTPAFVGWTNVDILSTSFSLGPNLYSNSKVRTITLIWFFFFQQRQENGLPSKLSKRFNPTCILQEERNLSFKTQGNKDRERNRYDSDMRECLLSHFSCVRLTETLQTIACQAPLSMGFSRQEYWSELPCPHPGDLLNPGIKPVSLMSLTLAGRFLTASATWGALWLRKEWINIYHTNSN